MTPAPAHASPTTSDFAEFGAPQDAWALLRDLIQPKPVMNLPESVNR